MRMTEMAELKHYGIPGMKWGVRRYENYDGTLTSAGKARYGKGTITKSEREALIKNPYDTEQISKKIAGNIYSYNEYSDIDHYESSIKTKRQTRSEMNNEYRKYSREFLKEFDKGNVRVKDVPIVEDQELLDLVYMDLDDGGNPSSGGIDAVIRSYTYNKYGENNSLEKAIASYVKAADETDNARNILIENASRKALGDLSDKSIGEEAIDKYFQTYLDTVRFGVNRYLESPLNFYRQYAEDYAN